MSDNDLIKRGDIKKQMIARGWKHPDSTVTEFVEDDLPAVPQEMSARELFNAYQRICEEYSHKGIPIRCDECPLYSICPEIGRAMRVMVIWSTIIKRWARKHPERSEE